ncbi:hypothetical protein BCR43DRAFT_491565 [Syncephalastrum racemosum]|uniref:Defect at low temperature protein 1 n=1 Tax=Syncephalastrum racemosum TaxID=13706 RepID=A0A1X2HC28_SYNRA|nr:hypothetical protein BCR43DRAFT_491565 [Syncephalastrum racemosum]
MKRTRLAHSLYTGSLFFLILLTAVCIAISAADVIIQALADRTESGTLDFRNLIVVAASYVLLAIVSLSFSCSRVLTVKASLQDIPKDYIPIKSDDLPKRVYTHIAGSFEDVKEIRKVAEPRPEDIGQVGWAKPGETPFEGVDFKRAIARTPSIIEKAATEIDSEYARPLYVPIRQYLEFLMERDFIDSQLGHVYIEGYERARFSQQPVSQDEYLDIMKHLAAILNHMGYHINNTVNRRRSSGGAHSSSGSTGSLSSSSRRHHPPPLQPPHRLPSPRDDDVVSLAQSVATWSSRSTSFSRYPVSTRPADDHAVEDEDEDEDDAAYDEEMRNIIYNRLMMDRSTQR